MMPLDSEFDSNDALNRYRPLDGPCCSPVSTMATPSCVSLDQFEPDVWQLGDVIPCFGFSRSILESLQKSDEPLRKKRIEQMTKDHAKQVLEKDRINKGQYL